MLASVLDSRLTIGSPWANEARDAYGRPSHLAASVTTIHTGADICLITYPLVDRYPLARSAADY